MKDKPYMSKDSAQEAAPELCRLDAPGPFGMLIFGASGDLTRRKLIPALYRLMEGGLLPENFFVLGASDLALSNEAFRESMQKSVQHDTPDRYTAELWDSFAQRLYYEQADAGDTGSFARLKETLFKLESKHHTGAKRLFYLAVPPRIFEGIIDGVGHSGLASEDKGKSHIVIEKPFGHDLASSEALDRILLRYFKESQIYRMDHYLAKETVQNILMFRFANSIFDTVWDRRNIDHVQITVAETLGVEGRSGYYEQSGVLRDMFQNHIFQLLALTAMEPPSAFDSDLIRNEKVKVFSAIRPFDLDNLSRCAAIGQYAAGTIDGRTTPAYRSEPGIAPDSATPTYAALKVHVDNWRWEGVPFYLRSGKRLATRKAEIAIHFREVPHMMFLRPVEGEIPSNVLILRVQPDEGVSLSFQTKAQGTRLCLNPVLMDYSYEKSFSLSGYERVMLDCLVGDQTLFVRGDGVRKNWELFTPLINRLEETTTHDGIPLYEAGSQGPEQAHELMARDGRQWRHLEPQDPSAP